MKTISSLIICLACVACTPTIKVAMPEKPLEINLNVKVNHKITIEMSKDLDTAMTQNDDIF